MLIDGEWHTDVEPTTDERGAYQRVDAGFRDRITTQPDARFPPEPDRYHLYISRTCPWAHGAALVRQVRNLTDVISLDVVDPIRFDEGWEFSPEKDGCTPDTATGSDYLREVYVHADPDYTGRVTTPVLWDTDRETIVNNESIEIMRMLTTAFPAPDSPDVYPPDDRGDIDRIVAALYDPLNNGVYRAGFAGTQAAYDDAVREVFEALDRWDTELADRRYLTGDRLTLADLRLFPTLIRFDEVCYTHFKCNRRRIVDYDNLWPYLRDLYGTPGVAATVNFDHIRQTYRSGGNLNPSGIIPIGPDIDYDAPHDRDRLADSPHAQ